MLHLTFELQDFNKTIIFILSMSYYKILVEPAKSSKGICKVCEKNIKQDSLRLQVADDREFNDYIQKHGGRSQFHG
jgi:hypothetical protein